MYVLQTLAAIAIVSIVSYYAYLFPMEGEDWGFRWLAYAKHDFTHTFRIINTVGVLLSFVFLQ